jgi:hypothetical protein
VFLHLRREGGIISQHDGPPGSGARPVYAWRSGEYIIDEHPLTVPPGQEGDPEFFVGMYDPISGQRQPMLDAAGGRLGDELSLGRLDPGGGS